MTQNMCAAVFFCALDTHNTDKLFLFIVEKCYVKSLLLKCINKQSMHLNNNVLNFRMCRQRHGRDATLYIQF